MYRLVILLFFLTFFLFSCKEDGPDYIEGNYSGILILDKQENPLFVVLRLGELKENQKFITTSGSLFKNTDFWKLEGAITTTGFTNTSVSGTYLIMVDDSVFFESQIDNNSQIKFSGKFQNQSNSSIYGSCIQYIFEDEVLSDSLSGSFEMEK